MSLMDFKFDDITTSTDKNQMTLTITADNAFMNIKIPIKLLDESVARLGKDGFRTIDTARPDLILHQAGITLTAASPLTPTGTLQSPTSLNIALFIDSKKPEDHPRPFVAKDSKDHKKSES